MIRRNDGRRIGRTGPVIGLPAAGERLSSYGATGAAARAAAYPAPPSGNRSGAYSSAAIGYELRGGERSTLYDDRRDLDAEMARSEGGSRFAERLGIARLFGTRTADEEALDDAYSEETYQEAPRVVHKAGSHREATVAQTAVLFLGGLTASTLLFSAGFLAAVLVFGEPGEGDNIAIRTGAPASQALAEAQAPQEGRAILPPPAPDISSVEARSEAAFGSPQAAEPATAPTPSSTQAQAPTATPPVQSQPIEAPPQVVQAPANPTLAEEQPSGSGFTTQSSGGTSATPPLTPPAVVQQVPGASVSRQVIYPPAKPTVPPRTRVASAAPQPEAPPAAPTRGLTLGPPGGQYSLQFGAFRDRANAEGLVRELSPRVQARIAEVASSTGVSLFYVRGGAFDSRTGAVAAARDLRRDLGVVSFVYANRVTG